MPVFISFCVWLYVFVCVSLCLSLFLCVWMSLCVSLCVCVSDCVFQCVLFLCACASEWLSVCLCVCLCVFVCLIIHVCAIVSLGIRSMVLNVHIMFDQCSYAYCFSSIPLYIPLWYYLPMSFLIYLWFHCRLPHYLYIGSSFDMETIYGLWYWCSNTPVFFFTFCCMLMPERWW